MNALIAREIGSFVTGLPSALAMDPNKQFHGQLQRFEVFCREIIDPALFPICCPLEAAAHQCSDPIPFAQAAAAFYAPVNIGWEWGPVWSTCWFRVRGQVPREMAGRTVVLRFSTDTEALVWAPTPTTVSRGTPVQGLDVNRDSVRLFDAARPARGGETIELFVEAACNHLFGDRGLQWDPPEIHRRWNSATPGRLDRCELAVLDETVWRLKWVYTFALQLARELPHDSARARELFGALRRCTNAIPDDRVSAFAAAALAGLEAVVRSPAGGSATLCHAVGHAHIDTAWLWPIRETKRKCQRTFSTTLRLMERDPGYRFLCSQAQQYAWLEQTSPELFEQVKTRVAQGRWEPGGGMWVEPDCNVPSGESLIRQILHADRYWRAKFGDARGRQRFLYLPDTFGFPPQLPQIMRLAGLDTFITNKLHWNDTNVFPHTTFIWRGLDGSEVIGHNTPGMDYNALLTPRELIRGEKTHKNKDLSSTSDSREPSRGPARWLQPFGFGDGGGGPTEWNLLNAELAASSDSLPRVRFSSVNDFCDALHADIAAARRYDPASIPVHEGELYLELHRGTFTTHARIKQANAECEELLRQAEILTFAGPTRLPREQELAAKAELDRAWKLLLLNQFHDILPGSSIGWVYQDAERDYAAIRAIAQPLIDRGMAHWAAHVRPLDSGKSVCLFNLSNGAPPAWTTIDGQAVAADSILPLCVCVIDCTAKSATFASQPIAGDRLLTRHGLRVHSHLLAVEFDRAGRIVELEGFVEDPLRRRFAGLRPSASAAPHQFLNRLALYEDRPRMWDAWDFDAEHVEKATFLDDDCEHEIVHDTPERVAIRFTRRFGRGSRITQTFTVLAGSRHVEIDTEVDWHEEHRLLRVHGPIHAAADTLRLGTQFGERSVSVARNSSAERAAFELPFHHFISDPHSGLTWVFPDRHGASIRDRTLGVTLLRSPRYPDAAADIGLHRFRYAIAADRSFAGWGWIGQSLLAPPRLGPVPTGSASRPHGWAPLESGWSVAAIKPAEDDDRLIVRLVNASSFEFARSPIIWRIPITRVEPVDLLERPMPLPGFEHDAATNRTILPTRPFGIVTLAVTRAD